MPAPQFVIRSYGGGADVGQLVQEMNPGDLTFTIAPDTGWVEDNGAPLGTSGPFSTVVDRFTPSVEKILCSAINLTTGLVNVYVDPSDGWSGRGYDGTQPQGHVPGGSPAGVQTCWTSAEAKEANRAVFDVLGGGSSGLVGVPIGTSIPFNGTGLTTPANFLLEDGSLVSRTTYSALFTAITVTSTGNTTLANRTINNVPAGVTQWIKGGAQLTLAASGGAIYTVQSITATSITLTSGTGITAGTGLPFVAYPHGAGDGSTTFAIPDSRGRTKSGWSQLNTNAQPSQNVGQSFGGQTVTLAQNQLPTVTGTAAAQGINDPKHHHLGIVDPADGGGTSFQYVYTQPTASTVQIGTGSIQVTFSDTSHNDPASTGITTNSSAVSNAGGGQPTNVESPGIGCTWMIRAL
jgi:microcystin-dependent protein